jgi:hypothetical protein
MKSVALIVCSNGYGHVRRTALIASKFLDYSVDSTLFAPLKIATNVVKSLGISGIKIIDFDTKTTVKNWTNGEAVEWIKLIDNLDMFDYIICDNLVEILEIYPNAWLSGSFFWHESITGVPKKQIERAEQLLRIYRPNMISSKLFSSKSLSEKTNLYEVGLYRNPMQESCTDYNLKTDVLISAGRGGDIVNEVRLFVVHLANFSSTVFTTVWVDPFLLPKKYPSWMRPALFNVAMYRNLIAAVIRPGVGTLTDSLTSGARIFSFYESGNIEVEQNTLFIDEANLGCGCDSIKDAWNRSVSYATNMSQRIMHKNIVKNIDFNGSDQAVNLVLSS